MVSGRIEEINMEKSESGQGFGAVGRAKQANRVASLTTNGAQV